MRWPWRRRPKGGRVVFIGGSPFDAALPQQPVAAYVPEERLGIQLGFADGSTMTLDDDDPRAVALREAAARLTGAT